MTNKRKILFVNDEMQMGGVARVLNTLMKHLDKDKYEIDCLVLHPQGMLMNEIPEGIHVINGTSFFSAIDESLFELIKHVKLKQLLSKVRLLFYMKTGLIKNKIVKERQKMLTKHYDVEMACKEGFCTIFTAFGDSDRKLNWVLTDYSICNYSKNHMKLVKESLGRIDLNIADSMQAMDAYEQVFNVSNGHVIHNLMDVNKVLVGKTKQEDCIVDPKELNVITCARLHPQKSIDRMLVAYKYVKEKGYEHNLYIIGDGECEESLKKYAKENHLDKVFFVGAKKNPYADIAAADLFILTSKYEGFATVINESLIAGTPVLSTRVSGVEEQILEKHHGWICENNQVAINKSYLHAVKDRNRLLEKKELLKDYHYPNDEIIKQFEEVL